MWQLRCLWPRDTNLLSTYGYESMNLEAQATRSRIIRAPVPHSTCQSVFGPAQREANISEAS